jgi:hypothetical protein
MIFEMFSTFKLYFLLQALSGFLLILDCQGEVFFATHTIENYLGFHQVRHHDWIEALRYIQKLNTMFMIVDYWPQRREYFWRVTYWGIKISVSTLCQKILVITLLE